MVARGVLAALGSAAIAAATQSLAATAAPASAIFQQNLRGKGGFAPYMRDETLVSTLTPVADGGASCTAEINEFRTTLGFGAEANYVEVDEETSAAEIAKLADLSCADAASGKFSHIAKDQFVFSAPGVVDADSKATCTAFVDLLKEGFAAFENKLPPKYQDPKYTEETPSGGVYADPKAAAFLSTILEGGQKIYCGIPECAAPDEAKKSLLCFISGSTVAEGGSLVKVDTWAKALAGMKVAMPAFAEDAENLYLAEMNKARAEEPQKLQAFTDMSAAGVGGAAAREGESFEDHFKLMTCDDIKDNNVYLHSSAAHTFIYATKEGETAPTPEEAVAFWKGGLKNLKSTLPAFSAAYDGEAAVYKLNDVAGFVSLMAEEPRKVKCQTAKSCPEGKSAVVCVLVGATLVDKKKPIADSTWEKIKPAEEEEKEEVQTKPTLKALEAENDLLKQINAYRTQEALGLKEFKAPEAESQSELLKAVTCEELEKSTVKLADASNSLMYFTAAEAGEAASAASALSQWKKGFAKLGKELPPAFDAQSKPYTESAAAAFLSLVSDKVETVSCFTASGCSREALICQLAPPALADGKQPLEQATWDKVFPVATADPESSGGSVAALSFFAAALALAAAAPLF